jgi:anti-anti-sigma factor
MLERTSPNVLVIRAERYDGTVVLALDGELDLATSPDLELALLKAGADCGRVVLDLSALEFMDSTGLHVLLKAQGKFDEHGWRLSLLPLPPQVRRLFELTGTQQRFEFEERPDDEPRSISLVQ